MGAKFRKNGKKQKEPQRNLLNVYKCLSCGHEHTFKTVRCVVCGGEMDG